MNKSKPGLDKQSMDILSWPPHPYVSLIHVSSYVSAKGNEHLTRGKMQINSVDSQGLD